MDSPKLLECAEKLAAPGLQSKDSLHLACAITGGCVLFFTQDDGIVKKKNEIPGIRAKGSCDLWI